VAEETNTTFVVLEPDLKEVPSIPINTLVQEFIRNLSKFFTSILYSNPLLSQTAFSLDDAHTRKDKAMLQFMITWD
jgi:hypothetical protein